MATNRNEQNMADNSQLDFRLKIYVLELNSAPKTMAQASTITSPSPPTATTTTTVAIKAATAAVSVTDYVTRTIDTFNISRNDIEYRAEGNANIVLAMPQRCQVLRLPKKSKRLFDYFVRLKTVELCGSFVFLTCAIRIIQFVCVLFGYLSLSLFYSSTS